MIPLLLGLALQLVTGATSTLIPIRPKALVAANPEPSGLLVAALNQCKAVPTLLACYVYLQNVYENAKVEQRKYLPQVLAPTATFLGRYQDAARWDPFKDGSHELPVNLRPLDGYRAVAAVEEVAKLAKRHRLVMINEWHLDASTRYLTLALLPKLYKEGFRYLAVEGLSENGKKLSRRGYAVAASGYYTREPIYAALLSRAVQLGYKLVRYDVSASTQQGREDAQAKAIYNATFAVDPRARVLVHAGVDHIDEKVGDFGPNVRPMAMQLHKLSGINPLTIDQTVLHSHAPGQGSRFYQILVKKYAPNVPTILINRQGEPWSARPGMTDVSVLAPEWHLADQRPSWLALWGLRRPVPISTLDCHGTFSCAVSARPVDVSDLAVPVDRYVFLHDNRHTALYVDPGQRYRIEATGVEGHLLSTRVVNLSRSIP